MTATGAGEASTPMIRAERLTKVYSAPNAGALLANFGRSVIGRPIQGARALDGIDFAVEPGEALGIVGRNGSGKSTLLQVLSGALQPTSGRLEIRGRLGTLLDLTSGINPEYTGAENAVVLGMLAGLSRREVLDRMDAIRAFSGLGDAFDRAVKSYSSGMGMRLGFSAAIHSDPEVLLIDEALAVGDAFYQQRCLRKMRALRDAGVTIVLVSHDPSAVISLCDRALWLESGRIQLAGAPKDVMRQYLAARYQDDCALDRELSSGVGLDAVVSAERIEPGAPLVRADERFGDGRARIVGFDARDAEGTPRTTFRPGDPTRVVVTVEVPDESEGLGHPLVGFTLRNRLGDVVTASNNELEGIALSPLGPGDRLDVAFDFAWPALSGGPLSLSPAVAEGSIAAHAMSDWVENALVVETENPRGLFGWMTLEGVRVESGAVRPSGSAEDVAPASATSERDASA